MNKTIANYKFIVNQTTSKSLLSADLNMKSRQPNQHKDLLSAFGLEYATRASAMLNTVA
jgi:hypothetical protein